MGRPRKQTVDYFPHDADASDRKTLYILESKFGNDGYAFWFKLLEILANSEGHFYDCRNPAAWEFLLAKTHVTDKIGRQIMATLLGLEAIDQELWTEKIVWSENFVNGIADAYRNRKTEPPPKPSFLHQKQVKEDITTPRNSQETVVSTVRNPHTILKDTKLKETKGEVEGSPTATAIIDIFNIKFPYAFGREPDSREVAQLRDLALEIERAGGATEKQIHDAFAEAASHNKLNVSYVKAILRDWLGVKR